MLVTTANYIIWYDIYERVIKGTAHTKIRIDIFPGDIYCGDVCLLLNIIEFDGTYVVVLKVMNYTVLLIRGKCASAHR